MLFHAFEPKPPLSKWGFLPQRCLSTTEPSAGGKANSYPARVSEVGGVPTAGTLEGIFFFSDEATEGWANVMSRHFKRVGPWCGPRREDGFISTHLLMIK